MNSLTEILDYIDNFDEKDISVSFMFFTTRSGSFLLHSLLDDHKEIILIPISFPYYFLYFYQLFDQYNSEKLMGKFFSLFINNFKDNDLYKYLGEDKNELLDIKLEKWVKFLFKILKNIKNLDSKKFFLAVHFSYAVIHGQDLKNIKVIINHHHFMTFPLHYYSNNQSEKINVIDKLFSLIKKDFTNAKLIFTIRNPFDSYYSNLKLVKDKKSDIFNIIAYYFNQNTLLTNYSYLIDSKLEELFSVKLIKFEDLHLNPSNVINDLINFLGISHSNSLLESTLSGKQFWGSNPLNKPIKGVRNNFNTNEWKDKLTLESKYRFFDSLNYYSKKFNYEEYHFSNDEKNLLEEKLISTNLIDKELESIISLIFLELSYMDKKVIYNTEILFSNVYNHSIRFEPDNNLEINNTIRYKKNNFYIRTGLNLNIKIPENSYFILIDNCEYYYLPEESIEFINKNVDELWVPFQFIKDFYLKFGVLEEKIYLINTFANFNIHNLYNTIHFDLDLKKIDYKTSKNFKFLFYGELSDEKGLDLVIKAFIEEFNKNEDVSLIIVSKNPFLCVENQNKLLSIKEEYKINYFDYLETLFKNKKEYYQKIINSNNNIPEIIIYDKTTEGFDLESIYKNVDSFIYPYRLEGSGLEIMEAMLAKIPVITTKGGISTDFCNDENSYLVKSDFIKNENNQYYFEPDILELKKMMRNTFENTDLNTSIVEKAYKNILNNYSIEKTMSVINYRMENVVYKPIFRYNIENYKKELLNKSKSLYDQNNYRKSSYLFYNLMTLDSSNEDYLFLLALSLMKNNSYLDAIKYFSKLLSLNFKNKELYLYLSECLENVGDFNTSKIFYDKAELF